MKSTDERKSDGTYSYNNELSLSLLGKITKSKQLLQSQFEQFESKLQSITNDNNIQNEFNNLHQYVFTQQNTLINIISSLFNTLTQHIQSVQQIQKQTLDHNTCQILNILKHTISINKLTILENYFKSESYKYVDIVSDINENINQSLMYEFCINKLKDKQIFYKMRNIIKNEIDNDSVSHLIDNINKNINIEILNDASNETINNDSIYTSMRNTETITTNGIKSDEIQESENEPTETIIASFSQKELKELTLVLNDDNNENEISDNTLNEKNEQSGNEPENEHVEKETDEFIAALENNDLDALRNILNKDEIQTNSDSAKKIKMRGQIASNINQNIKSNNDIEQNKHIKDNNEIQTNSEITQQNVSVHDKELKYTKEPSEQQQIKHSLPIITVTDPHTGHTVTWRMSQPVQIWSVGINKWCPGEISYITQDEDGYCLDVRYWAKPQQHKAKYLAPLSDCLRPISSDFTCRNEWTSGSKIECFSNSQKRWYKATVVDVIRYPDDKEDWLRIQWSLEYMSKEYIHRKLCLNSNQKIGTPEIMSKEVGRSSIFLRHRYPSAPPNISQSSMNTTHNNSRKKPSKKKRCKSNG